MKEGSREGAKTRSVEKLAALVVDTGYRIHVEVGPGLLESVYEAVLAELLMRQGLRLERQLPILVTLMGLKLNEGFRADLLVEKRLMVELRSVEKPAPVHSKQVLTYLRLLNLPLGLLINFGAATFKEGCKRIVNQHADNQGSTPSGRRGGMREGAREGTKPRSMSAVFRKLKSDTSESSVRTTAFVAPLYSFKTFASSREPSPGSQTHLPRQRLRTSQARHRNDDSWRTHACRMKLKGILDFSLGNFLCLRGFAPMGVLQDISEAPADIQRKPHLPPLATRRHACPGPDRRLTRQQDCSGRSGVTGRCPLRRPEYVAEFSSFNPPTLN